MVAEEICSAAFRRHPARDYLRGTSACSLSLAMGMKGRWEQGW
ncbi:MAG: hypothetical protein OJF49_001181 [Ktedonobacterales bacterium]|nr:MAG: hypothetical protein OJF49_001181 [Ktedonobacterales bacterium]